MALSNSNLRATQKQLFPNFAERFGVRQSFGAFLTPYLSAGLTSTFLAIIR